MKRFLCFLILLLPTASAQRELVTAFDDFNGELSRWCGNIEDWGLNNLPGVSDATTWVCSMRPAMDRAAMSVDNLTSDANGFFANAMNDIGEMVVGANGFNVGGVDIGGMIAETSAAVQGSIEAGEFAFSPYIGELLAKANQAAINNITAAPEAGASEAIREIMAFTRHDPLRISAELGGIGERSSVVMRAARAQDVVNSARESAAMSFARGDEEQLLKRTTSPEPGLAKGAADKAQDLARTANSSRAAFQANVQMVADAARLDAVGTANITTAIKENSLQQTYTTQQLGTLIQTMSDQQQKEADAWRQDYIDDMSDVSHQALTVEENLLSAASVLEVP